MFECLCGDASVGANTLASVGANTIASVGANTLASMVQAWLVVEFGVADLDVCLLSRVRCGNRGETKGAKTTHRRLCNRGISQHQAANHSTCFKTTKKNTSLLLLLSPFFQNEFAKSLVVFEIPESKCIRSYISGDIGIQWYADIMWS